MKKNRIKNNKIKQLLMIASLMNFSRFFMGNESESSVLDINEKDSSIKDLLDDNKESISNVSTEDEDSSEDENSSEDQDSIEDEDSINSNKDNKSDLNKQKKNSKAMKFGIAAVAGTATAAAAFGIHKYIKRRKDKEKQDKEKKDKLSTSTKVGNSEEVENSEVLKGPEGMYKKTDSPNFQLNIPKENKKSSNTYLETFQKFNDDINNFDKCIDTDPDYDDKVKKLVERLKSLENEFHTIYKSAEKNNTINNPSLSEKFQNTLVWIQNKKEEVNQKIINSLYDSPLPDLPLGENFYVTIMNKGVLSNQGSLNKESFERGKIKQFYDTQFYQFLKEKKIEPQFLKLQKATLEKEKITLFKIDKETKQNLEFNNLYDTIVLYNLILKKYKATRQPISSELKKISDMYETINLINKDKWTTNSIMNFNNKVIKNDNQAIEDIQHRLNKVKIIYNENFSNEPKNPDILKIKEKILSLENQIFDTIFNQINDSKKSFVVYNQNLFGKKKVRFENNNLYINLKENNEIKNINLTENLKPEEIVILKNLKNENIESNNPFISYINALNQDNQDINMLNFKKAILAGMFINDKSLKSTYKSVADNIFQEIKTQEFLKKVKIQLNSQFRN
jgi:hypothetical protein